MVGFRFVSISVWFFLFDSPAKSFYSCQINSSKIIPHSRFWYIYQFEFNDLHDMVLRYLTICHLNVYVASHSFTPMQRCGACVKEIIKRVRHRFICFSISIPKRERMQFNAFKTCNVMYCNHETIILNLTVNFMKFKCAMFSHCICPGTFSVDYGNERQT